MEDLKKSKTLCVPNYKTNPTHLVLIVDYKWWVNDQLLKVADLALHPKVIGLFDKENKLIEKAKMNISSQEELFIRQSLAMRAIPAPKLLIKDHKTINKKG